MLKELNIQLPLWINEKIIEISPSLKKLSSLLQTKPKPPSSIELSRFELIINIIRNFFWIPSGESPPTTRRPTIIISFISFIVGVLLTVFGIFYDFSDSNDYFYLNFKKTQIFFLSTILIIPSLYVLFIFFCCWRRVQGYDWWMIPQF